MIDRRSFCGAALAVPFVTPTVEKRSYLDNGRVRIGCDLSLGGAITYLSAAGRPNMVNSWDLGRQIQMSYYSGPAPLVIDGKRPAPMWAALGWNPVQSGDHFRNPSRLLSHRNDGKSIHVRCTPQLWTHDAVPAECTFETWITLEGPAVEVKCRLTNRRTDRTLYPARDQEMPAVYLNARYHRLMTYTGNQPATGSPLTRIVKRRGVPGPWSYFTATECWAALVDDEDFGVLVHDADCYRFVGGFAGRPGKGGPRDAATSYVAPIARVHLDHDIVHEYAYTLVVGRLDESRKHLNLRLPKPPTYRFSSSREGWTHSGLVDGGWPIRNELRLLLAGSSPELVSPVGFWQAADAPRVTIEVAVTTKAKQARVYWATHEAPTFDAKRSVALDIIGDGTMRTVVVDLGKAPGYTGAITQLRLDPVVGGAKGDIVRVKAIDFGVK